MSKVTQLIRNKPKQKRIKDIEQVKPKDITLLPDGDYQLKVVGMIKKTNNMGNVYLGMQFVDGDYKGTILWLPFTGLQFGKAVPGNIVLPEQIKKV